MIKVENLSKSFSSVKALDAISFEILRGETVGILGPNGAGKTTLMRILSGFLAPTDGKVFIDGIDISKDLRNAQRRIGYLPESAALYKELTVREMISFSARMKYVSAVLLKKEIERVMETCGLNSVSNRMIGTLSKGFRQRVSLATALVGSPKILILDEPTSGLDPEQIVEIRELIRSLSGERTVILSTHILSEVAQLTERVLILQKGKLIAADRIKRLKEDLNSQQDIIASVLGPPVKVLELITDIRGVEQVVILEQSFDPEIASQYLIKCSDAEKISAEVSKVLVESDLKLVELKRPEATLEDIYLRSVRQV